MAAIALRQLLKSFCTNSPWKYAALWKLRQWRPMSLTWEDGYFVYPIPRESMESISSDAYPDSEIIPSHFETSIDDSCFRGYPIGLVVARMSHLKYTWGKGVVGKVAHTGNHCWVSYDDAFNGKANWKIVHDCPEEWLLQFASGIKTIVLVPVLPHGVLQLGSLEMVAEDSTIPACIKDRFACKNIHTELPSSPISSLPDKLEESSSTALISPWNSEDLNAVNCFKPYMFQVPGMDLPEVLNSECENRINISSPLSQSISSNLLKVDVVTNAYPAIDFSERPFGDYNLNDISVLSFPEDCELYKALGPAFRRQSNEYLRESSFPSADVFSDIFGGVEPASLSATGGESDYLLQAVVGRVYDGSFDIANRSNCVLTYIGLQLPTSCKISASFTSTLSTLTDNENLGKDGYYTHTRKGPKQSSISRRKARPCDNPKARPRDRQMIQDRLKELRELVPNGAKYSIDALLEQTVKHMLYLRRVTNQAEKLQQWVHREVTGRQNIRSFETKDNYQLRTSWVFEIGDELKVCPIVVEDLPCPGHLLIEMLCNEHGLFLEIAQVIRSFNLTILKGVIESYPNNTWAHFIVEASSGFHRLDIFWPLMQLLQRQRNPISSKI